MDLDEFLATHALLPWGWGAVDCSLALADWAVANGYADPANELRGTYSDELGWKAIVVARGGLLPLVSDICDRAGILQTSLPVRGVVGVIGALHNADRQWGAIHDGTRWLVRGESGWTPLTAHALGMWVV